MTAAGGGLWATGVGGPATGKGFHLGLIDDPIKDAEQAASETIRSKQQDWYGSVFSTRWSSRPWPKSDERPQDCLYVAVDEGGAIVGDGRADVFNECRAGGLHGDAR